MNADNEQGINAEASVKKASAYIKNAMTESLRLENRKGSGDILSRSTMTDVETKIDKGEIKVAETRTEEKEKATKIKSIKAIENGNMTLELSDGTTVDSKDAVYGSKDEGLVYETVQAMGVSAGVGNTVIKAFAKSKMSANAFMNNAILAYNYGVTNQESRLQDLVIPSEVRNTLFVVGRDSAVKNAEARLAETKKKTARGTPTHKVTYVNDIAKKKLNANQKATVAVAEFIAASSPLDVRVFESYRRGGKNYYNIDGVEKESLANGWFVEGSNIIYLDINAGNNYNGLGAFTLAHEVSHYIRGWNATEWQKMADVIVEIIDKQAKTGSDKTTFEQMLNDKLSKYEAKRKSEKAEIKAGKLSAEDAVYSDKTDTELRDMAYEDVICDSLQSLFQDKETFVEFADSLKKKNKVLWNKFKQAIRKFLDKLDTALKGFAGEKAEGFAGEAVQNALAKERDQIRKLFVEAFEGANKNFEEANRRGNAISEQTENIRYSARELDSDGSEYWQIESEKDIFRGINETSALRKAAYNFILHGDKGNKIFGLIDGKNLEFIRVSAREYVYGRQSQTLTEEAYKQKMRMSTSIIDLIDNATMQYDAPDHKNHKLFPNGFKNYQGRVGIDSTIFRYIVRVGKAKNGMIFYDINLEVDGKVPRANRASLIKTSTSDHSISQSITTVNTIISEKSKNSTEKYSDRDYSYDNLVSKPDMKVTQIGTEAPSNRADIVFEAKRNASKIGKFNVKDGSVSVYVDDIGTDVILGTDGLKHGLRRSKNISTDINSLAILNAGEIIKHSVKINELIPKDKNATSSYVLIGCAENSSSRFIVRSIINTFDNSLSKMDVLYAVKVKESAAQPAPGSAAKAVSSVTDSKISITDLLDYVNRCFPEVLSADVLKHFGHESRPEGNPKGLGESMLYSDRDITLSSRYLLANALESTARNEVERDWLGRYKADIEKYNAEQDKLTTLNEQIKELSFGKGKRDMAKLRQLRDEKIKTENRITIYDKRLLRIETAKPLQNVIEREKTKAKNKALQQGREALEAYKRTAAQKMREEVALRKEQRDVMRKDKRDALQKQRDEYRQKEETKRLRRDMTYYRDGIKKIREDFVQRLMRGSETNFVPETLANNIIDICNAIDPTGRVYYKHGTHEVDIERTRAEYEFDKGESRAVEKYDTAKAALLNLKNEYDKLQNDANYDLSSEYDEEFSSLISQLADNVGDTPLREMNLGQLENVYNILSDINFMMKTAARQIGTNENISNYEAGQEIIGLMKEIKRLGLTTNKAEDFFRTYTLNPMRAVKEMSAFDENSRLVKLFNALNEGRRKADTFRMNVNKKLEAIRDKDRKAYNDAVEKEYDFGLTDIDGNEVHISKMQAMFAVLTARREAANADRSHLQTPVLFPSLDLEQKGKYEDAKDNGAKIMLDGNAVAKIMDGLSAWDKEYLAAAEKVFNEDCKDAVNATTMQIKHRPVALEASYVPYIVNQDYIAKESDNIKFDKSILNEGILKAVKKNAQQQLIMQSLNSALDDHIGKVAKLYGLAVPIRNWNKVFNMRQTTADGGETVKTALRETWHKAGVELLDRAVADMQSSRMTSGNDAISKALQATKSAFIVSTLASNISVSIKQAASYPTAGSVLSAAALTKGLADYYAKIKDGVHAQDVWDEIDEHTSQHWIRRQGLSTQELGELVQSKGILNKLNNKLGKASPMNWIQAIDVGTTAALWYACKVDVRRAGYAEGSREYWNKVTELYDKVIEETQPMYDSLHRAEITKGNELVKNIVMFQTQPIQNSGILRESAMELKMAKRRFGKSSEQVREANRKFVKAVASQAASHLTFTAMTLLAQMLLHRMNPWRDKDGEVSVEGVSVKFLEEFAKSYFGAIVPIFGNYGTSIIEAFVSKFNGKSSYDILSDATVDKINGTVDKFLGLTEPSWDNVTDALCEVATYFGIPAENIKKIIMGAKYHIEDIANGDFLKFKAGYNGSSSSSGQAKKYIDLMDSGEKQKAKAMYDKMVSDKKEEIRKNREKEGKIALSDAELDETAKKSVNTSVKSEFRKQFVEAFKNNDEETKAKIRVQMLRSGLWKEKKDKDGEVKKGIVAVIYAQLDEWVKEYKQNQ